VLNAFSGLVLAWQLSIKIFLAERLEVKSTLKHTSVTGVLAGTAGTITLVLTAAAKVTKVAPAVAPGILNDAAPSEELEPDAIEPVLELEATEFCELELPPSSELEIPVKELELSPPAELEIPAEELEFPAKELELPDGELVVPAEELEFPAGELGPPAMALLELGLAGLGAGSSLSSLQATNTKRKHTSAKKS